MMDWNQENTLFLLQLIREKPVIWDANLEEHKDKNKRLDALSEIGKNFNVTKEEINSKWISLKGQFNREKKKVTGLKTGSGADAIYVPKWFAYQEMADLLSCNIPQGTISNYGLLNNTNDHQYNHNFIEQGRAIKRERPSGSSTTPKYIPRKRPSEMMPEREPRDDRDRDELDECELYGRLLAKKMRKLNERQRDIAMHEIDNIIFRAKMNSEPPQQSHHSNYNTTNKMRKYKNPESPVFIVTEQNEHYQEEYLEDPMQEA